MQYLGDFSEDATVYIPFNTFSSDDPQASVTITNLADADIKVHKNGSTTEIVTDGATIAIDFDAIVGNHLITIDTSAHADYTAGADYLVRIEGTTVDAGTINAFIGSFSIENRYKHGVAQTVDNDIKISKIPLSDGAVTFNSTALASINTECDTAISDASLATAASLATVDTVVDAIKVTTDKFVFTVANQVDSNMLTHTSAIPNNYITSAGIASSAMNGKGDWNIGKTGYALTTQDWNTVAPDNSSIAAILADTNELQLNQGDWTTATGFSTFNSATDGVIVTTNNDKTDYSITGTVSANISTINGVTITGNGSTVPFDVV